MGEGKDLMREMEMWLSSGPKITLARFFRQNPGVIDTLGGLSRRLAIPSDVLRAELADHVRLGVIRERGAGDQTVYMLDQARRREIEETIVRRAQEAAR